MLKVIVRVGMTLHATKGYALQCFPGCTYAIHHRKYTKLLVIGAAFVVALRQSVECGSKGLTHRRIGQEVTRELLYDKLVVGLVTLFSLCCRERNMY